MVLPVLNAADLWLSKKVWVCMPHTYSGQEYRILARHFFNANTYRFDQWKTFILKIPGSDWRLQFLSQEILVCWRDGWSLARFRACLLFACLRAIECMFVRAFFTYYWKEYFLVVGFFFLCFLFVFLISKSKMSVVAIPRRFGRCKMQHVVLLVNHGCLLVLLACSTRFGCMYIYSCEFFLAVLCVCFACLFRPFH